jgi:hypothetical protein
MFLGNYLLKWRKTKIIYSFHLFGIIASLPINFKKLLEDALRKDLNQAMGMASVLC